MFGSLGVPELLLIFAVALIVFGPRKLPEIGRTIGKALGEFRRATEDLKTTIAREVEVEELKRLGPQLVTPLESVSRGEPPTQVPGPGSQVSETPREPQTPEAGARTDEN
ncbi:MAG TPA: twin-arginine translocase TatA/TatE family subunit [Thermoanaerobaculia bacterium]|nr:twin-arginine translocase TatA/TatE family subunit [Thermoanaerobaculia bacterium]